MIQLQILLLMYRYIGNLQKEDNVHSYTYTLLLHSRIATILIHMMQVLL